MRIVLRSVSFRWSLVPFNRYSACFIVMRGPLVGRTRGTSSDMSAGLPRGWPAQLRESNSVSLMCVVLQLTRSNKR